MLPDGPTGLFGALLSGPMCPVTDVVADWERLEALGAAVMAIVRRLAVNPAPPITMTQGITRSGVIGMMWTVKKDIMIPSNQRWREDLSLPGMFSGWTWILLLFV